MILLFDVNGFIAGMQSVVPVANTFDNQYFDYDASAAYNKDVISGVEVIGRFDLLGINIIKLSASLSASLCFAR